jgi:hypothetical protein
MRLIVNFHHDGTFTPSPLMYKEGDVARIPDIDFVGMTLIRLSKLISGACQFPVKGIYFLIPGRELSNGLKEIKDDNKLAEFVALGFKNEKEIDLYVEHHGYDLSHWLQNEIGPDDSTPICLKKATLDLLSFNYNCSNNNSFSIVDL